MGAVDAEEGTTQRDGRRLYGPALVLGLLGALGVTAGSSRPWIEATASVRGLPPISAAASGADLSPLAGALGVVILAAFGAVIATRGWVRRGLGVAIVLASGVVVVSVLAPGDASGVLTSGLSAKGWSGGAYRSTTEPWRWLVLVSALGTGLAGGATARYGDRWAVMGGRYEAPGAGASAGAQRGGELSENDVWQAIDSGRDPTQEA
jgi:uncharacterized membrane protein (TIGR02234 family)